MFLLFIHLKLELLTQFPVSEDEKYIYIIFSILNDYYLPADVCLAVIREVIHYPAVYHVDQLGEREWWLDRVICSVIRACRDIVSTI